MTNLFWKKMIRDMRASMTTYILCIVIVAIGFCGYSVLELCYGNLLESRDAFFRMTSFCDGFADVKAAPTSQTSLLERIPGIDHVDARLVKNTRVAGYEEDVELHLVSWQEGQMNRPKLSKGSLPQRGKREIVIGDGIAKARNLKPGDSIDLIVAGRQVPMEITGVGVTPENIYMIKDMSSMFPDPLTYDAAFTSYDTMEKIYSMEGEANSFLFSLKEGYLWKDVEERITELLEPYGGEEAYSRDDQLSVNMVNEEMNQLRRMSGVVPAMFLMVAGVILYITLSRLVEQQRTLVGTFMALGIPIGTIQLHYMGYGAFTGFLGGLIGGAAGYLSANPMANFYRMYFNLPKAAAPVSYSFMAAGVLASSLFCAVTAWLIAGSLGRLSPAMALRPATPKAARRFWLEKIPGFTAVFTVPGLMAVRSLSRNRRRTVLAFTGIAFAYMITATLVSMNSLFNVFLFDYWEKTQRQDIMIQFDRPVSRADAIEAVRDPGVITAEGLLEFPVTLTGPRGKSDCVIQAIDQNSVLCRLYREGGERGAVEKEGIVLSEHMAKLTGVRVGDTIQIKVSYPKERISRVEVTDIIAQYMGTAAYMSHEGAALVSDYGDSYTTVLLKGTQTARERIEERLKEAAAVGLVESRQNRVDKYRSTMGSMSAIMASMSLMGVMISCSVIYISSLISFEELKREISTLLMLGMNSRQCLDVISTSQWILAGGAVILGIPMTLAMSRLISVSMASDLYTIPDFVDGKALLQAVGLTALSVFVSSRMMLNKLRKLSPAELLRERE